MLAGLPKAPSALTTRSATRAARACAPAVRHRPHGGERLHHRRAGGGRARSRSCSCATAADPSRLHAEYVAETVRQLVYAQYGDEHLHPRPEGLHHAEVAADQEAAYKALRKGIMDYERRQIYRGPEKFVDLPGRRQGARRRGRRRAGRPPRQRRRDGGRGAGGQRQGRSTAVRGNGERVEITGEGLRPAQSGLSDKAPPKIKIRRGAVIRVVQDAQEHLGDHAAARGRRRLRRARPARRRHPGAGRRLRLRQEQVQPRHAGLAPAGLELQALHLLGRAREGLHAGHRRQRRAAVLRCRRHRRPALGAEELRRQVRRPDAAAHGAGQVQEHGVDPHPAGHRHAERAGLDHPLRLRRATSTRPT